MNDNINSNKVLAKQLNAVFTIKLSVDSLLEEIFQGHVGSPNQTRKIVHQTLWIHDELKYLKEFLETFSLQNPENFSVTLLKKSITKMIYDFNKLGIVANQMALSRIRCKDATKEYKQMRILMNSVSHTSSQLYDQMKSLNTR